MPTRRIRIEDLTDLAVPEQPALSPDGTHVVYVLRTSERAADKALRNLWRVPTGRGEARQLTRGGADSAPTWSPDGTQLAFVRAQNGPLSTDGGLAGGAGPASCGCCRARAASPSS